MRCDGNSSFSRLLVFLKNDDTGGVKETTIKMAGYLASSRRLTLPP